MKKNRLLYIAAVAGLVLAGCAKEQRLEPETTPGQMRFAVSVDGATKAGIKDIDALKKIGEFYIKVETIEQADPAYDYREIVSWNDESGTWTPSHPMLWKNENAAIKYTAVASGWLEDLEEPEPFNTVLPAIFTEEGGTLAIRDDQSYSSALAASDLLSMTATNLAYSATTGGVVPVTFTHALAKVNFQLNLADGFFDNHIGLDEDSNPVDHISIGNVYQVFNFKALSGVATVATNYPAAAVEPYEGVFVPGIETNKVAKATYESVLPPQTFEVGALTLDFSIMGVDYRWTNDKAITLAQGKTYTIPVDVAYEGQPDPTPPAPLTGVFSVSDNKKVSFSRGNLQATYDGEDWTWGFAENQWDYLGAGGANLLIVENGVLSAPGTVDYFHWSVKDSYFGIYPVMKDGKFANYELGEFRDWGEALGFGWRTLSEPEWDYLLNGRASGSTVNAVSDARYTRGTINTDGTGVNGLILIPDGVTIDASEATAWGQINTYEPFDSSGWRTKCTTAQWTALAAKGCVFLPTAGYRGYNTGDTKYWYVSLMNEGGYYWTSTKTTDYNAYMLSNRYDGKTHYKIITNNDMSRVTGNSVRLVKPVPSN